MSAWSDNIDSATLQRIKTYSAFNDAESKNLMLQTLYEAMQVKERAQVNKIKALEKTIKDLIEVNEQKRAALFKIKETINEYWATIRAENSKEATK